MELVCDVELNIGATNDEANRESGNDSIDVRKATSEDDVPVNMDVSANDIIVRNTIIVAPKPYDQVPPLIEHIEDDS